MIAVGEEDDRRRSIAAVGPHLSHRPHHNAPLRQQAMNRVRFDLEEGEKPTFSGATRRERFEITSEREQPAAFIRVHRPTNAAATTTNMPTMSTPRPMDTEEIRDDSLRDTSGSDYAEVQLRPPVPTTAPPPGCWGSSSSWRPTHAASATSTMTSSWHQHPVSTSRMNPASSTSAVNDRPRYSSEAPLPSWPIRRPTPKYAPPPPPSHPPRRLAHHHHHHHWQQPQPQQHWRENGGSRTPQPPPPLPMTYARHVPTHRASTTQDVPAAVSTDDSPPPMTPIKQQQPQPHPRPHPHQPTVNSFLASNLRSTAAKRPPSAENGSHKRPKGLDRLDLLVSACLEMGPLHENPSGCSCPKSKCVALYCDCFKAGRRCDPSTCSCVDCKNTIDESGPEGARTKAIRSILARNPRAFLTAGLGNAQATKLPPGEVACNCIRSRCLKLYCSCFQNGKVCKAGICSCIGCLNTVDDTTGDRQHAIDTTLEKRPDAFRTRVKEVGMGCACKNNRCIRKYCECFRNELPCTAKCSCNKCENHKYDGTAV